MNEVIAEIESLEHFRFVDCSSCGEQVRIHVLQIHVDCPNCGAEMKCRAFGGIGTEIQDVIDAVLAWAGEGEEFQAVLARRQQILSDPRN